MNKFVLLFCFSALFFVSEGNQVFAQSDDAEHVVEEELLYLPNSNPYQASKTKEFDLIHTKLEVSFDWGNKYLNGKATISLKPHAYVQDSLVLDAKGFEIKSIKRDQKDLEFSYDSLKLYIAFSELVNPSQKITLEIVYVARPDELQAIKSGYSAIKDDKGLYFINPDGLDRDKPKQIWTQGETEASSCWFPTIDAPNQKMTQELYITTDTNYTVLSNGEHVYTTENGDGTKTSYWKQDKVHAPYLAMMAIGEFSEVKDSWNGIDVNYYVEKDYEKYARDIFGNTPEMLTFFSEIFDYPYPWDKYSQVVVRDYVSGAMENTSASIFMEQLQMTDRELLDKDFETVIAHELFHHWFGDLVTCESWSNLPLNESFANYSEYLWLEYKYGLDEAERHRLDELTSYFDEAESKREPLIRFHYGHRMEMFDRHSYNKGGLILHMLRDELGSEVFFRGLNLYLKQNEYADVEVHQLRLAFEKASGKDLNWFFNQWFMTPGHPELSVVNDYKNGITTVTIDQLQNTDYHDSTGLKSNALYRLPSSIALYIGDRQILKKIVIDSASQSFKFNLGRKPDAVILDPERILLADIQEEFTFSAYKLMLNPKNSWRIRYNAIQAIGPYLTADDVKNIMLFAINDSSWVIRKEGFKYLYEMEVQSDTLKTQAMQVFSKDDKSHVRAEALRYLMTVLTEKELMPLYVNGFEDRSYAVNAVTLEGYLSTEAVDKGAKVQELRDVKSASLFNAIVTYYTDQKDSIHWDWMIKKFEDFGTGEKIEVVDYLSAYAIYGGVLKTKTLDAVSYFKEKGLGSSDMYMRYICFRALIGMDSVEGVGDIRKQFMKAENNQMLIGVFERLESSISDHE